MSMKNEIYKSLFLMLLSIVFHRNINCVLGILFKLVGVPILVILQYHEMKKRNKLRIV